ncbi:hypothetical protein C7293_28330 [filamentous cyanobacterium CCT1]|nr:hypothetical protein C7293_28330 [filamentous cyanobacterium CCT1]PSN76705.1 hypothetical protein C8B47_25895 [filamentous cyanobacterium CCP4]
MNSAETPDQPALEPSVIKARNTLLALFVALCVLDLGLVILAKDKWAIARILLTAGVMYLVWQGRKWAKWVLLAILTLLVVSLVALVIALRSQLSTVLAIGSVALAVLSAITAIYMTTNPDLQRFLHYKRQAG